MKARETSDKELAKELIQAVNPEKAKEEEKEINDSYIHNLLFYDFEENLDEDLKEELHDKLKKYSKEPSARTHIIKKTISTLIFVRPKKSENDQDIENQIVLSHSHFPGAPHKEAFHILLNFISEKFSDNSQYDKEKLRISIDKEALIESLKESKKEKDVDPYFTLYNANPLNGELYRG